MSRPRVGSILLDHRKVTRRHLVLAVTESRRSRSPVLGVLRRRGVIDVFDAAAALLEQACARLDPDNVQTRAFASAPSFL